MLRLGSHERVGETESVKNIEFKVQDKPLIMMRPANQLRFIKMTSAEVFAASYQRYRIR